MSAPELSTLLDAARAHGEEDDPDHEVGDLQMILEACWKQLTTAQKRAVFGEMREALADWMEEP